MKETIATVHFTEASHDQIRALIYRLDELMAGQKIAHVMLTDIIHDAKSRLSIHETVLNRPVGSSVSEFTKTTDGKRDKATRNLFNKINTAADEFDEETAGIGLSLKKCCDDYGGKKIVSLKLAEQTDRTRRLLAVLHTPEMMAKIDFLGLGKDLRLVEQLNNEFEMFWQQRITEHPESSSISQMKDVRRELDGSLTMFLKSLKWLKDRQKTGLDETTYQAIRALMLELSSDLKAQNTIAENQKAKVNTIVK